VKLACKPCGPYVLEWSLPQVLLSVLQSGVLQQVLQFNQTATGFGPLTLYLNVQTNEPVIDVENPIPVQNVGTLASAICPCNEVLGSYQLDYIITFEKAAASFNSAPATTPLGAVLTSVGPAQAGPFPFYKGAGNTINFGQTSVNLYAPDTVIATDPTVPGFPTDPDNVAAIPISSPTLKVTFIHACDNKCNKYWTVENETGLTS